MASKAEQLAARKRRERKPRNQKPVRNAVLGCRLRILRDELDLTIRDVAGAIGMSQAGYHAVEQGCDTSLSTALRISEFFDKPITEIWSMPK